jgi:hypothetical protein
VVLKYLSRVELTTIKEILSVKLSRMFDIFLGKGKQGLMCHILVRIQVGNTLACLQMLSSR